MKRSTERFLTTHTGSLPRPEDLVRAMFAKEEGVPVDRAALDARIRSAVAEIVKKQAEAGDAAWARARAASKSRYFCTLFSSENTPRMASVEKMSRNTAESINDAGMGLNLRKKVLARLCCAAPGIHRLNKMDLPSPSP